MRSTILLLTLSLLGSEAAHAAGRFGTFKTKGYTFKISRARMGTRGALGPRNLTITSRHFPGVQLALRRKGVPGRAAYHATEIDLVKSVGRPSDLKRMTRALGMELTLPGSSTGIERLKIEQQLKYGATPRAPEGSVLRRLIAMELGMTLPRPKKARRPRYARKKVETNPSAGTPKTGDVRTTHVTVTEHLPGAIIGNPREVSNFRVTTERGKPGGVIHHSDGSSQRLDPLQLRRTMTGGPGNSPKYGGGRGGGYRAEVRTR